MRGSKTSCGCQQPQKDPYQEGLAVVWHDPTSYDPEKHAPPYMPSKVASEGKALVTETVRSLVHPKVAQRLIVSSTPLTSVLSVLQAAAFLHKTHHWQTHGGHYYADHLLFDRLYDESQTFIDQVAERAVGSSDISAVSAEKQAQAVAKIVGLIEQESEPEAMVASSLRMESLVLAVIQEARSMLERTGQLTNGIDNLLQGAADLHETFVYLLKQRSKPTAYSYSR